MKYQVGSVIEYYEGARDIVIAVNPVAEEYLVYIFIGDDLGHELYWERKEILDNDDSVLKAVHI